MNDNQDAWDAAHNEKAKTFQAAHGLGEALIFVRVGECIVTLHRKETTGRVGSDVPEDSFMLMEVGPQKVGGSYLEQPWSATLIGTQRVIAGSLPPATASAKAVTQGKRHIPVQLTAGAFLLVAPSHQQVTVTFRNAQNKRVKQLNIHPMPDLEALNLADGWVEDPDYVPAPDDEWTSDNEGSWDDQVKRYGLGPPVITVSIGNDVASLYQQRHTGKAWLAVTSGSFGPIGSEISYRVNYVNDQQVIAGSLPPTAVTAAARTEAGQPLPIHVEAGAFLMVAPAAHEVQITFHNAKGRRVWQHHIETKLQLDAKMRHANSGGFFELLGVYWLFARLLWLRWRARGVRQYK
jgi:hypothetical protein